MAAFPPGQLCWLVRNMDAAGTAEKRATHQAVHSERFAKYKAAHPGVLGQGLPRRGSIRQERHLRSSTAISQPLRCSTHPSCDAEDELKTNRGAGNSIGRL
ncbi:unnamed protein product [Jaminaea pallidilutea]